MPFRNAFRPQSNNMSNPVNFNSSFFQDNRPPFRMFSCLKQTTWFVLAHVTLRQTGEQIGCVDTSRKIVELFSLLYQLKLKSIFRDYRFAFTILRIYIASSKINCTLFPHFALPPSIIEIHSKHTASSESSTESEEAYFKRSASFNQAEQ
ncbi:MAG: hypothetical protein EZS28_029731 [Streblomastix strix]|uniref:Uncharacterized protein n=1 Tax=Streblomastix strix TaxID=222440 RepID=A0A5J4UWQ1_9EUKA|nr:MAG: hypothetical protein EZS28_029731 [Streblomastix strix]